MAAALAAASLATLAACERTMRDMYDQPRKDPGEASPLFADGKAGRPPPEGSVAHSMGALAATSSGRRGSDAVALRDTALAAASAPEPITRALLLRGQERYAIYCLPCHSAVGDGDGPVVRRGFPAPPSYHQPRLREADDRHFFDVIGRGYGVMPSYGDRVSAADRWAIVAYIRTLQLSQSSAYADLPPRLQAMLDAAPAANGSSAPSASAPTSA
ncbi:MAG: cytochrome c, partial [Pseudomonadota bacterium]|nr:cytochrome c [Pseudomonadota bacterium]